MENELISSLDKISESLKKLDMSVKSISGFTKEMLKLNEACLSLSSTTSNMDSKGIVEYIDSFNTVVLAIQNIAEFNRVFSDLKTIGSTVIGFFTSFDKLSMATSKAIGVLSSAMGFLAAHPIVAIGLGLGALVTGLALFSSSSETETTKVKDDLDRLNEKVDETGEKIIELRDRTKDSLADTSADYQLQSKYLKDLVDLTGGSDGYVENIDQARYYVEKLNEVSEGCVSITEDGYVQWKSTADAIQENINKQKQLLELQVYEEQYIEAIKQEKDLKQNLSEATSKQREAQEKYNAAMADYMEKNPNATYEEATVYCNAYKTALDEANETLQETTFQYEQNKYQMDEMSLKQLEMNGSLIESSLACAQLNLTLSEVAGRNGEVTASYASLGENLQEYDQKLADHASGVATMSEEELIQTTIAKDAVLQSLVEKASAHGQSYATMLENVKKYGIELSEEEAAQLKTSYDNYTSGNVTQESIQTDHFNRLKALFQQNGIEMSDEQLKQITSQYSNMNQANEGYRVKEAQQYRTLLQMLKDHNINFKSEKGKFYIQQLEEAQKNGILAGESYLEQTAKGFENKKGDIEKEADETAKGATKAFDRNGIEIKIDTKQASKDLDSFTKKSHSTDVSVKIRKAVNGIKIGDAYYGMDFYESGGFPDTGELFVAREAGPELVGRINGKTAVANNDQIVSGISAGVFNAVRSAMQGQGKGNMNIHATFVMDGEVVGKQVIKYHNGVVKRTGATPLMI